MRQVFLALFAFLFVLSAVANEPVAEATADEKLLTQVNQAATRILSKHGKPMPIAQLQKETVKALNVPEKNRTLSDTIKALVYRLINRSPDQAKKDADIYGATIIRADIGLAGIWDKKPAKR